VVVAAAWRTALASARGTLGRYVMLARERVDRCGTGTAFGGTDAERERPYQRQCVGGRQNGQHRARRRANSREAAVGERAKCEGVRASAGHGPYI